MLSSAAGFLLGAVIAASVGPGPPANVAIAEKRPVGAGDILGLRDIGTSGDTVPPFSLSPDARTIAFAVRQAIAETNSYRITLYMLDIGSGLLGPPILIPGQPILAHSGRLNQADWRSGGLETLIPRWSPDGRWLAFLVRLDGHTRIARIPAAGGPIIIVPTGDLDVDDWAWGKNSRAIEYTARPGVDDEQKTISAEGNLGFHYDERWMPTVANTPLPGPVAENHYIVDLTTGISNLQDDLIDGQDASVRSPRGELAKLESSDPTDVMSPNGLVVVMQNGDRLTCTGDHCANISAFWWSRKDGSLLFLRRSGWADSDTELVKWRPGRGEPHVLLSTENLISGCASVGGRSVCIDESATRPRHLVEIDETTGVVQDLYDPNPGWAQLRLGTVTRYRWKNRIGLESFGDLVLPPALSAHPKLPLVVVGYTSRGFLRGGTGDEYPIFGLVAKGFAVLSFQNPKDVGYLRPARTVDEAIAHHFANWADRRSVDSSLMIILRRLVRAGTIDRARIGITGVSNGSENATFSIIHHPIFRAAALSSCCDDPVSDRAMLGPAEAARSLRWGYPVFDYGHRRRTLRYSLAANAPRIDTPILLQMSDREYLYALEAYSAFQAFGKAIDLYVYPDEYHLKWQPAHRMGVYNRTIAWFRYWLMDCAQSDDGIAGRAVARWEKFPGKKEQSGNPGPACH